jgi:hypothetical protein
MALEPKIVSPVCAKCGGVTRLIGIEAHLTEKNVDTLTFECEKCSAYAATRAPTGQHARMAKKRRP